VIALEPPPPSPSTGLAARKGPDADGDGVQAAEAVPTLATLANLHTGEALVLSEVGPTPERFAALVEDRVTGSRAPMDPRLLGLLRGIAAGREEPPRVEIVSGYRSWKLNEILRKKGRRVASHSQHSLGSAIDFRVAGTATGALRDAIRAAGWKGGVGYYPNEGDRFVHADCGPERSWRGR
jgi:uncharacterized protein YcbK (DUF882 family)